ncbi:jg26773 [Pararge aegeria aegeria]|uniref:Jg26773 protein n=1 Tax=Pararge aegeria aegeria TaxID=348720 RepID=A0A8S4QS48_9NEOP|nr:jg26773 [Pararge aegeria aegeria]
MRIPLGWAWGVGRGTQEHRYCARATRRIAYPVVKTERLHGKPHFEKRAQLNATGARSSGTRPTTATGRKPACAVAVSTTHLNACGRRKTPPLSSTVVRVPRSKNLNSGENAGD